MGDYTIAVLVGWAIAVVAVGSVLFTDPDRFSAIGTSKRRWFLIELTAFIPYVGFIAVLIYVFKVRVNLPPPPPRPPRHSWESPPPSGFGAPNAGGNTGRGPMGPPGNTWEPPQKQRCGVCNGGTNPCYGCSNGYVNRTEFHGACGGTGRVKCVMCNGTGFR
jgi:hypothetical protein